METGNKIQQCDQDKVSGLGLMGYAMEIRCQVGSISELKYRDLSLISLYSSQITL